MRHLTLILILGLVGCANQTAPPVDQAGDGNEASDPNLELVRKWLRENLDSGDWEEVRWWHARPMKYCSSEDVCFQRQKATMAFLAKQEYQKQIAGVERDIETLTNAPDSIVNRDREYWESKIKEERQRLLQMKAALPQTDDAIEREEQRLQSLLDQTPVPLGCRLKYRSRNKQGAFELQDQVFIIVDNKALPCLFQADVLRYGKDFPED